MEGKGGAGTADRGTGCRACANRSRARVSSPTIPVGAPECVGEAGDSEGTIGSPCYPHATAGRGRARRATVPGETRYRHDRARRRVTPLLGKKSAGRYQGARIAGCANLPPVSRRSEWGVSVQSVGRRRDWRCFPGLVLSNLRRPLLEVGPVLATFGPIPMQTATTRTTLESRPANAVKTSSYSPSHIAESLEEDTSFLERRGYHGFQRSHSNGQVRAAIKGVFLGYTSTRTR